MTITCTGLLGHDNGTRRGPGRKLKSSQCLSARKKKILRKPRCLTYKKPDSTTCRGWGNRSQGQGFTRLERQYKMRAWLNEVTISGPDGAASRGWQKHTKKQRESRKSWHGTGGGVRASLGQRSGGLTDWRVGTQTSKISWH